MYDEEGSSHFKTTVGDQESGGSPFSTIMTVGGQQESMKDVTQWRHLQTGGGASSVLP